MKDAREILISLGIDEDNEAALGIINEVRKEAIIECAKLVIFEPYVARLMLSKINKLK